MHRGAAAILRSRIVLVVLVGLVVGLRSCAASTTTSWPFKVHGKAGAAADDGAAGRMGEGQGEQIAAAGHRSGRPVGGASSSSDDPKKKGAGFKVHLGMPGV